MYVVALLAALILAIIFYGLRLLQVPFPFATTGLFVFSGILVVYYLILNLGAFVPQLAKPTFSMVETSRDMKHVLPKNALLRGGATLAFENDAAVTTTFPSNIDLDSFLPGSCYWHSAMGVCPQGICGPRNRTEIASCRR